MAMDFQRDAPGGTGLDLRCLDEAQRENDSPTSSLRLSPCAQARPSKKMATEIERKFLLRSDIWRPTDTGTQIRQGYLRADERCAVRVRVADRRASITIKASQTTLTRHEFEYEIPRSDAEAMLASLCGPLVEKTRYHEAVQSHVWEIDIFQGDNEGLAIAELEVASETEAFASPPWLGAEVSDDPRYYNSNLAKFPYTKWTRR